MGRATLTKQQQHVPWLFRDFRFFFFHWIFFSKSVSPDLELLILPIPQSSAGIIGMYPYIWLLLQLEYKESPETDRQGACPRSHSYNFNMLVFVFCPWSTHSNCRLPFCPLWDLLCQACLILQAIWFIQTRVTLLVLLGIPPLGLAGSLGQGELQGGKDAFKLGSLESVKMACVGPLAPAAGWWELGSAVT